MKLMDRSHLAWDLSGRRLGPITLPATRPLAHYAWWQFLLDGRSITLNLIVGFHCNLIRTCGTEKSPQVPFKFSNDARRNDPGGGPTGVRIDNPTRAPITYRQVETIRRH